VESFPQLRNHFILLLEIGATANVSETLLTPFKKIIETCHYIRINSKANSASNLPYTLIQCNDFPVLHLEFILQPLGIIGVARKPGGDRLSKTNQTF
jgi:hypothetical protein